MSGDAYKGVPRYSLLVEATSINVVKESGSREGMSSLSVGRAKQTIFHILAREILIDYFYTRIWKRRNTRNSSFMFFIG